VKTSIIRNTWLSKGGYRLDCSPYLGGGLETEIILEELSVRKDPLAEVTKEIFNGPQFVRNYVKDQELGVPFMTGSSMLLADLSDLPLLSKRDALSDKLAHLQLKPGITLISCSGSIGKMAYSRPGMEGIWASQDVLKVVPDEKRIYPGYLYGFLSSKFGVPLITSGTYGAIIQHLEPEHICGLPVPRFGEHHELEVHELVEEAARRIDCFESLICQATKELLNRTGLDEISRHNWEADQKRIGWTQHKIRTVSLRALNYDARIAPYFQKIREGSHSKLGDLCVSGAFRGRTTFTRIDASGEHGVKLVGQREAFRLWPDGRMISRVSIEGLGLLVPSGTTLIPSHGTLGEFELYCKAVYVTKRTSEYAFSGDFFRCVPIEGNISPGYLFAFLRSHIAFRMLRSTSTGGKQQEQNQTLMNEFPIPRLSSEEEKESGSRVDKASVEDDRALDCEEKARSKVEAAILNS